LIEIKSELLLIISKQYLKSHKIENKNV